MHLHVRFLLGLHAAVWWKNTERINKDSSISFISVIIPVKHLSLEIWQNAVHRLYMHCFGPSINRKRSLLRIWTLKFWWKLLTVTLNGIEPSIPAKHIVRQIAGEIEMFWALFQKQTQILTNDLPWLSTRITWLALLMEITQQQYSWNHVNSTCKKA